MEGDHRRGDRGGEQDLARGDGARSEPVGDQGEDEVGTAGRASSTIRSLPAAVIAQADTPYRAAITAIDA
ncbi:MAG TPA: hypothetical protein VI248_08880 [Kineosporiaceae bacterium]